MVELLEITLCPNVGPFGLSWLCTAQQGLSFPRFDEVNAFRMKSKLE